MTTPTQLPSHRPEWRDLLQLAQALRESLKRGARADQTSQSAVEAGGITLDCGLTMTSSAILSGLTGLAVAQNVETRRRQMIDGALVNRSENRAALHCALRAADPSRHGADVGASVMRTREKMQRLAEALHSGGLTGSGGAPITDIVNIGIGGSEFGSRLLCNALGDRAARPLRAHFIAGVDAVQIDRLCRQVDAATTLFIVSSKSFSTVETLLNAKTLLAWSRERVPDVSRHWYAVTGKAKAAIELGVPADHVFDVPDWVGGRFSAWGAVGLPAALVLGWPTYAAWLAGGAEMDEHHFAAPLAHNLPALLGLLNVWHSSFLECPSHCIVSYDDRLREFLSWAQQLEMESNGKSVTEDGVAVDYPTAPIVWGGLGNSGQHTYYQLLREGTHSTAITMITAERASSGFPEHAAALTAQANAQATALTARDSEGRFNSLARLHMRDVDARSLGALMAAFEHATTVAAWVWGINPFDQPGVEYGKKLAARLQQGKA